MTAEIAILNNSGIALAADSAVTIGEQKVYNSANKLFTLSKYHPVGIMVYDSANLMGIPWEIIIKEYRSKLGKRSFPTLAKYADNFWEFLSKDTHIIPSATRSNYIVYQVNSYLDYIKEQVEGKVKDQIAKDKETSLEKTYNIFLKVLKETEDFIFGFDFIPGFDKADADDICNDNKDEFERLAREKFGTPFDLFKEEDKVRMTTSISNLFVRQKYLLPRSGVVIAGFGTTEMFPKIASYLVEGVIGNRVKKTFDESRSTVQSDIFITTIVPFAQDEMVQTFMRGIDPEITQFTSSYLSDIFSKYPESLDRGEFGINEKTIGSIRKKLVDDGLTLLQKFNDDLDKFKRKNNIEPILDMVAVLPKDELAAMAESLVNLTVFKRKVSKAVETVGGPIDVAVISKGDGFIWVKRKHYFKPELNPHFFPNYLKEVQEDNE